MATAKTPAAKKAAPKAKVETYVEPEPEVLATIQPETKKVTKKKVVKKKTAKKKKSVKVSKNILSENSLEDTV